MKQFNLSTTTAFKALSITVVRLLLWLMLLVLVNEGLFYVLINVYPRRGNDQLEIEKAGYRFSRVFLGSSRTHMGIHTPLLDSLKGEPLSSFNMAAHSATLADQYIVMENIFALGGQPKEMIFELIPPLFNNTYEAVLLQGGTGHLWQTSSLLPLNDRWNFISNIISHRFKLLSNLNLKHSLVEGNIRRQGYDAVTYSPATGWEHQNRTAPFITTGLNEQHRKMLLNTTVMVNQIIRRCQEQGVRVLFLLPVQLSDVELYILGPVWNELSPALRWENRRHILWKELRLPAYWQDFLHVNRAGAVLYTKILADTYPAVNP